MGITNRKFSSNKYRYGFNGKENDSEVKGAGNQQDYALRIYDPRLGKFLSVDPITKEYPWNSTYAFAENDVMRSIDLEGAEKYIVTGTMWKGSGGTQLQNLSVKTLDKPGPLGNGIYYHVRADNYVYSSKGRTGNQYEVIGYIPATEEQPSAWNKLWAKILNGGAHDGGGANGSRSNQAFGIIFQSSGGGLGTTSTGTGNSADNFEVSEGTGTLTLLGGVGGKLSVLDLSEGAKRNISAFTKIMDATANTNESSANSISSTEDLLNKIHKEAAATPSNSSANTKQDNTSTKTNENQKPRIEPGRKSFVFRRLDDFGTGKNRERKGSIQDHAYTGDTTIKYIPGRNGSGVDTFEIKKTKN